MNKIVSLIGKILLSISILEESFSVEQDSINGIPSAAKTIGLQAVFKKFLRLFILNSFLFKDNIK